MTLTYDWTVEIDGVNVSALVKAGGTIDYGRPTVFTEFQAPQAVFEMFTAADYPNYGGTFPTVTLGDPVIIHVTHDGVTQHRRFTGVVQALDWSTAGMRVTCTGNSTDWQAKTCASTQGIVYTITNETETARVDRWCDQAGVTITIEGAPARRVRAVPADQPGQPLLDALLRIASDCDALLMEDRLGVVHYRTRNFDRPASYTLPAAVVERDSLDLVYERGTHINTVRVYYGEPDAATGNQPYVNADDASSYGTALTEQRLAELYTDIQYSAGAAGKASVYLEKHRLEWAVPDVVLVMNQATGAQADAILDLQENWMVTVGSLPTGCPIASYAGDILGFTDIMHETDYRIILHLGPRIADTGGTPETPIFPEDSITGGTTTTYEDGDGYLWQLHTWTTPASYTATVNNDVTVETLIVGGGGGGASTGLGVGSRSGGGGAGGFFEGDLELTAGSIAVQVGAGGGSDTNGGDSAFAGVTCYGGGTGGRNGSGGLSTAGANGGSGGGGGGDGSAPGTGTGGDGSALPGFYYSNGQQGGGGVAGNGGSAQVTGGGTYAGTNGRLNSITGSSVRYAVGGKGAGNSVTYVGAANTGSGGDGGSGVGAAGTSGQAGIVAVRYRIG